MTTEQSPPTTLSEERLRELKELYSKATPGPWHDYEQFGVKSEVIADSSGNWLLQSWSKLEEKFDNDDNNRAYVIALHNTFPSLLHVAEQMARYQWQPIESAPRDGTRILAVRRGGEVHRQWWSRDREVWMIDYADGPSWQPTYWMHLPPAPEKGGAA